MQKSLMRKLPVMIKKMTLGLVMSLNVLLTAGHAQVTEHKSDMLNFLLGEMAVQRNDLQAATGYLEKLTTNQKIPHVLRQQFNLTFGQGDFVKALSFIGKILEEEPNNLEALLFETVIYVRLNSLDKAADVMNRIAHLYEEQMQDNGFHFLYRELKSQVDPKTFLMIYEKVARLNGYSASVTPLFASLLVDNGRYQEAIDQLNAVIATNANSAVNYSLLMYAYSLLDQPEKGLQILKGAAEKATNLDVKLEYLQAQMNEFYYENALVYAGQLLAQYPNDPRIYGQLSILHFALNNHDLVKDDLEKMIQYKGDYANVIFKLAEFARTTGRLGELYELIPNTNVIEMQIVRLVAEADLALRKKSYAIFLSIFDELRTKFPDRAEYFYNQQLDLLEKSGDYQLLLSLSDILDVVMDNEAFIYVYFKALAHYEMQQYDQANQLLLSWVEKNPEDAIAINGYGYTLLELSKTQKDRDHAMAYLKKAIELAPDDPAILDSVGWGYFKDGNYTDARKYLYPAYNRLKQPDVIAHYVALLIEEKKLDEAKDLFKRLFIVYPTHKETLELVKKYQGILK